MSEDLKPSVNCIGLEAEAGLFDIKNPLIGFSDGFNSDNWKDVKHMLLKVKGKKT